jgi:hypothetical protein
MKNFMPKRIERFICRSLYTLPLVSILLMSGISPAFSFEKQIVINVVFDEIPADISRMEIQITGDGIAVPVSVLFSNQNNKSELPWIPFGVERNFEMTAYDQDGLVCRGRTMKDVVAGKVTEIKIACNRVVEK